jgi:hypothetical protein
LVAHRVCMVVALVVRCEVRASVFPLFRFGMVGECHGGCSLSDAVSAGSAWAGGVRGVSRGVCGVVGAGDGVGCCAAGAGW